MEEILKIERSIEVDLIHLHLSQGHLHQVATHLDLTQNPDLVRDHRDQIAKIEIEKIGKAEVVKEFNVEK